MKSQIQRWIPVAAVLFATCFTHAQRPEDFEGRWESVSRGSDLELNIERRGSATLRGRSQSGMRLDYRGDWNISGSRITFEFESRSMIPRRLIFQGELRRGEIRVPDWDRRVFGDPQPVFGRRSGIRPPIEPPDRPGLWPDEIQGDWLERRSRDRDPRITIRLLRNGRAVRELRYRLGRPEVAEGEWTIHGDQVSVFLNRSNGRRYDERWVLEHRRSELRAVRWDRERYGNDRLIFIRD